MAPDGDRKLDIDISPTRAAGFPGSGTFNPIDFRSIKDLMLQELHSDRSIQIILQTDHLHIRKLPFQLWSFFEQFPHAELAIASSTYRTRKRTPQGGRVTILI